MLVSEMRTAIPRVPGFADLRINHQDTCTHGMMRHGLSLGWP